MKRYVKYYSPNTKGLDFIVGDIHGMYYTLMAKLKEVGFDFHIDRLFSTGDLIDRGPESVLCLSLLNEDWFIPIYSNHEDMMMAVLSSTYITRLPAPNAWLKYGGAWYLDLIARGKNISQDTLKHLKNLPLINVITGTNRINIVHAEFPNGTTDAQIDSWAERDPANETAHQMIYGRSRIDKARKIINTNEFVKMDKGLSKTYVGHSPVDEIINIGQYVYIDTGAVFGGELTVLPL